MKSINLYNLSILLALLIVTQSCNFSNKDQTQKVDKQKVFAIKNVNVIPMDAKGETLKNATVIVKDNKIAGINKNIPEHAKIIDGNNKWLIPGLIDMHVHAVADYNYGENTPTLGATFFFNNQDMQTPYVANGVTTIFDLDSKNAFFAQRNEISKGHVIGPRMALAKLLDGGQEFDKINTPSDGRQAVRTAKANGYQFIKTYSNLTVETFFAIVDEAQKQKLKVVGHIPKKFKGRLEDAFVPNFGMVAHAEEFTKHAKVFDMEEAKYFAQLAKENGTWLTSSLYIMFSMARQAESLDEIRNLPSLKYLHPLFQDKWLNANKHSKLKKPKKYTEKVNKIAEFNMLLIKAFKEAGVPIVAGTDAMCSGIVPGFSLHNEIELLVDAGLTPQEALISSTRLAATWLGINNITGTIEEGKSADLVLLDKNPLEDIKNIRKISGVFVNGKWLNKSKIDSMLLDLSNRNTKNIDKYQWKNRRKIKTNNL